MKIKKVLKFIKEQIFREFFGFVGFLFSTSILAWGVIFKDAKLQTSSVSATGFTEVVFSIPVYIIGIILVLVFGGYLIMRRRR